MLLLPSVDPSNAAPEWQAWSFRGRSKVLVVACPLEGLVRMDRSLESLSNISFLPKLQIVPYWFRSVRRCEHALVKSTESLRLIKALPLHGYFLYFCSD